MHLFHCLASVSTATLLCSARLKYIQARQIGSR
uniref:Uncharacterized protein n=1 Tax=Arundo donax TaxID=35708 RepID=A0A0A9ATW2_ARUDO